MNDWGYDCFARDLGRAVVANIESQQRSADVRSNTTGAPQGGAGRRDALRRSQPPQSSPVPVVTGSNRCRL
ncbi:hypothetical protein ACFSKM_08915 [Ancylobacter dichloromethanicus]